MSEEPLIRDDQAEHKESLIATTHHIRGVDVCNCFLSRTAHLVQDIIRASQEGDANDLPFAFLLLFHYGWLDAVHDAVETNAAK